MKYEKVDILMATYNGEKYIREQLDSILLQSYSEFNLIISDDCSSDKTRDILKEYKDKDSRIILYFQDENLGSNRNFEFLLSKVKNKYYMFSDQDDVWNKDKVELSVIKAEEENADLVFTDLEIVDEKLSTIYVSFNKKMKLLRKIKKYNDYRLEYLYNCVTGCTLLAKSENLSKILPLPENVDILHDYWIALVSSIHGKVCYIDKPTLKYRQHGDNQVGIKRYTDKFKTFDEKRDYIIELKIKKFETYIKRSDEFDESLKQLNNLALDYFFDIKSKRYCNFKNFGTYNKIFKYESFSYYLFYFILYNFPFIFRFVYNLKSNN